MGQLLILTQRAGFSWAELPQASVLVDVGGGIGSQSILVAQAHPHIHVVVEDREQVVSTAGSVRFLSSHTCTAFTESHVGLQASMGSAIRTSVRIWAHVLAHTRLFRGVARVDRPGHRPCRRTCGVPPAHDSS